MPYVRVEEVPIKSYHAYKVAWDLKPAGGSPEFGSATKVGKSWFTDYGTRFSATRPCKQPSHVWLDDPIIRREPCGYIELRGFEPPIVYHEDFDGGMICAGIRDANRLLDKLEALAEFKAEDRHKVDIRGV